MSIGVCSGRAGCTDCSSCSVAMDWLGSGSCSECAEWGDARSGAIECCEFASSAGLRLGCDSSKTSSPADPLPAWIDYNKKDTNGCSDILDVIYPLCCY